MNEVTQQNKKTSQDRTVGGPCSDPANSACMCEGEGGRVSHELFHRGPYRPLSRGNCIPWVQLLLVGVRTRIEPLVIYRVVRTPYTPSGSANDISGGCEYTGQRLSEMIHLSSHTVY